MVSFDPLTQHYAHEQTFLSNIEGVSSTHCFYPKFSVSTFHFGGGWFFKLSLIPDIVMIPFLKTCFYLEL